MTLQECHKSSFVLAMIARKFSSAKNFICLEWSETDSGTLQECYRARFVLTMIARIVLKILTSTKIAFPSALRPPRLL